MVAPTVPENGEGGGLRGRHGACGVFVCGKFTQFLLVALASQAPWRRMPCVALAECSAGACGCLWSDCYVHLIS
jgi:hypothetical protein